MKSVRQLSIPVEDLDLQDGARISGVVKDGALVVEVFSPAKPQGRTERDAAEIDAFLADFTGKFANPEVDLSDDIRAQAILKR